MSRTTFGEGETESATMLGLSSSLWLVLIARCDRRFGVVLPATTNVLALFLNLALEETTQCFVKRHESRILHCPSIVHRYSPTEEVHCDTDAKKHDTEHNHDWQHIFGFCLSWHI